MSILKRVGEPFLIFIDGEKYAVCISKDYANDKGLYTLNVANDKAQGCLSCKISVTLSDVRKLCIMLTDTKSRVRIINNFANGYERIIIYKNKLIEWIKECTNIINDCEVTNNV